MWNKSHGCEEGHVSGFPKSNIKPFKLHIKIKHIYDTYPSMVCSKYDRILKKDGAKGWDSLISTS